MNTLLVLMMLMSVPTSEPAPIEVVVQMTPKFGPQRYYDKKWVENWVLRCSSGHQPYSQGYCHCIVDSSRFYWDFKTAKIVFKNVEAGEYVPAVWEHIEDHCWNLYENPNRNTP